MWQDRAVGGREVQPLPPPLCLRCRGACTIPKASLHKEWKKKQKSRRGCAGNFGARVAILINVWPMFDRLATLPMLRMSSVTPPIRGTAAKSSGRQTHANFGPPDTLGNCIRPLFCRCLSKPPWGGFVPKHIFPAHSSNSPWTEP